MMNKWAVAWSMILTYAILRFTPSSSSPSSKDYCFVEPRTINDDCEGRLKGFFVFYENILLFFIKSVVDFLDDAFVTLEFLGKLKSFERNFFLQSYGFVDLWINTFRHLISTTNKYNSVIFKQVLHHKLSIFTEQILNVSFLLTSTAFRYPELDFALFLVFEPLIIEIEVIFYILNSIIEI